MLRNSSYTELYHNPGVKIRSSRKLRARPYVNQIIRVFSQWLNTQPHKKNQKEEEKRWKQKWICSEHVKPISWRNSSSLVQYTTPQDNRLLFWAICLSRKPRPRKGILCNRNQQTFRRFLYACRCAWRVGRMENTSTPLTSRIWYCGVGLILRVSGTGVGEELQCCLWARRVKPWKRSHNNRDSILLQHC